jgi:hypothetical protein
MRINFDMDGTIADLYGIKNWLECLLNEDVYPYAHAKPLVNMSRLAKALNKAKRNGYEIAIISWGCKNSTAEYLEAVKEAKIKWLKKHLPSVEWTEIIVVDYGTPKSTCGDGILFDDELHNLLEWGDNAYTPNNIFNVLATL